MRKYVVLEVNGGIGKSIMASAVCEAISKHHPDRELIVFSPWIEPLLNNPCIYRLFRNNSCPYFYDQFVKNNDVLFLCQEPYRSHGYLSEKQHLIQSWCECIGVPYNGEQPSIHLTPREVEHMIPVFARQKPIFLIQPFGGFNKKFAYSWNRDLPPHQAQEVVNLMNASGYHVIQLSTQDQPKLQNVENINVAIRDAIILIGLSSMRLLIDSFGQHAAAALNKPSVVCWITNKPSVFGYPKHVNVSADWSNVSPGIHYIDGYFQKFDFSGSRLYDFPFKSNNVFKMDEIVAGLNLLAPKTPPKEEAPKQVIQAEATVVSDDAK